MANIQITNNMSKISVGASGTASASNTITLATAGTYVEKDIDIVSSIEVDVKAGSLNNAPTEGVTYTENTDDSTIIPASGKLYINEGYYPNTSISLGQMIPDDGDYDNAGTGHILSGYEAYNSAGEKLIGTIATITPSFTGGGVTATAGGSVTTAPVVTGKVTGTITSVATTSKPSGVDGTSFYTITPGGTATAGTVQATADASRAAVKYSKATTGYVNKASGTTAVSAGNATQNTKDISVTPTAANGTPYYIPVGSRSASVISHSITTAPTATAGLEVSGSGGASVAGVKTTAPSTGKYLTFAPTISSTNGTSSAKARSTTTAGYIGAGSTDLSTADTKSIAVTTAASGTMYIPVYEGAYTVS